MMMFNEAGRPQATYTPGPATVEGLLPAAAPAPPHPSPIDLEPHQFINLSPPCTDIPSQPPAPLGRKRKAEDMHNNERLSKRMSLLNLEQNGQKLYVPVEQPQTQPPAVGRDAAILPGISSTTTPLPSVGEEEPMQLDDTKHKVYIYDLDDELSSDDAESDGEGKLVFLPDIEKHLRANRLPLSIPKPMLPNEDGELAGKQLVLYSDGPSSISVPENQDSVRKAIIEARDRLREKHNNVLKALSEARARLSEIQGSVQDRQPATPATAAVPQTDDAKPTKISFATPVRSSGAAKQFRAERADGPSSSSDVVVSDTEMITDDDADAMDID